MSLSAPASVTLNGNQGGEYFIAPNIKATGKFYGNLSGKADTAGSATNLKVSNDDDTNSDCYLIWTNGVGDGSTARGTYTSRALRYNPGSHKLNSEYINCNSISSNFFNTEFASVNTILRIPTSAPPNLVDGSIWLD